MPRLAGRRSARRPAPAAVARLSGAPLPPLDLSIPPWPGGHVTVDGVELFIRRTPASSPGAEPALYVHGLGGSASNWTDLAAQLAPWLAGEALDLPGFGHSGAAAGGSYSLRAHARSVIAYLEQSGRGPVHLFGNSMGGAISILVAAARPDLVRTLTLISPAVADRRPPRVENPLLAVLLLPGIGLRAQQRMERRTPLDLRVRRIIELCFADPTRQPPHRIDEAIEDAEARSNYAWAGEAFVRSVRALVATYLAGRMWARMAEITAPTLVVWGTRDKLVPVRLAAHVARVIPDARLLVLDEVGHVAQMESPQTTARAVVALLEDVGVTRRTSARRPAAGG